MGRWQQKLAVLCVASVISGATAAHAETGLAWQWEEGQEHRFVVRSDVQFPEGFAMNGEDNMETFTTRLKLAFLLRCSPKALRGKRGWEMRCDIDDASIGAVPSPNSVGRMKPVLDEWLAIYRDKAWLEFYLGRDGRVSSIDLEGLDRRNRRMQDIGAHQRQVAMRALAPFNLQFPKKGDDQGRGQWIQRDAIAMTYPSREGSMGGATITHGIHEQAGLPEGQTFIVSHGEGTVSSAEEYGESVRNVFLMALDGSARFDRARGLLLENQFFAEGTPTASSIVAEGKDSLTYQQTSYMQWVPDGQEPSSLGTALELPMP
jgi:hypothetical protein